MAESLGKRFSQLLDETASTADVVRLFEATVKVIRDLQKRIESDLARFKSEIPNKVLNALKNIQDAESRILNALQRTERQVGRVETVLLSAEDKLDNLDQSEKTLRLELGTIKQSAEQGISKLHDEISEIPAIPEIPIVPDFQSMIDKLKEEHQEEIKKIRREFQRITSTRAMGMKKITSIRSVNLTSQTNGSLKAFRMPKDTLKVLGVWGTQFPITFDEDVDFTFTGRTLTLTGAVGAPASDQTLWALCETQFYA